MESGCGNDGVKLTTRESLGKVLRRDKTKKEKDMAVKSKTIIKTSRNSKAQKVLERERIKAFGKNGGIKCHCVKCGGEGYAQDETMLDSNGFLIDMKCPCGGAIRHRRGDRGA